MITKKELDWIAISYGVCIGAGVLFLPIQVGISGIWAFIIALPIIFSLNFIGQNNIAEVVSCYPDSRRDLSYSDIVEKELGKFFGKIIVFVYFLVVFELLMIYVTGFRNDLFLFITSSFPGLIKNHDSIVFTLLIILFFACILSMKQFILLVVMKFKTVFITIMIVLISLMLIPSWQLIRIEYLPTSHNLLKGILTCMPLLVPTTTFWCSISEMVVSFKMDKRYEDTYFKVSKGVIIKTMGLLALFLTFFVMSYCLAVSHAQILEAQRTSSTALSVFHMSLLRDVSRWISLIVLPISFVGVFIAIDETVKNLLFNSSHAMIKTDKTRNRNIEIKIGIMILISIFVILCINIKILDFVGMYLSPLMAFLIMIVPAILLLKIKKRSLFDKVKMGLMILAGLFVMSSYFIGMAL